MMHLSTQHRDLISVGLLLIILVIAFPLLGSWFIERVAPVNTPTPVETAPKIETPTPEPTKESRAVRIGPIYSIKEAIPIMEH